jgi:hypothetical protein
LYGHGSFLRSFLGCQKNYIKNWRIIWKDTSVFCLPAMPGKPNLRYAGVTPTRGGQSESLVSSDTEGVAGNFPLFFCICSYLKERRRINTLFEENAFFRIH